MAYMPIGPKPAASSVPVTPSNYPATPIITAYTPSTTAYVKVTPNALNLDMIIRARTASDDLIYAGIVTHKIADATTITSAAPTTDETDRLRATEFKSDFNTHVASTAYHVAAGTAIATADATDDATLIALCQALDAAMKAHAASTTEHGGRADAVFAAALVAAALPATPSKAECRTWLGDAVLKAAWTAHLAVTDAGAYVTIPAGLPWQYPCMGSFFVRTSTSGGTLTTEEFRSA